MIRRELLFGNDVRNKNMYQKRINFSISNEFSFKESFRINYQQAEYILQNIGDLIKHKTTKNKALTPKQQLLLCLHWLGNGCQYHGVGTMHGVTKGTVCTTVGRVCNAIVENLFPKIVCWPENVADIGPNFYIKGGFPNVCGCVDGTIINIDAPSSNEVMFVDRHGNHSLNVMMICGPNNLFYAVNANWPGSVHDSRVLRNSAVFHK